MSDRDRRHERARGCYTIGAVCARLAGRVPRHLDLEDPLPRGPGAARAEADTRRLPALQRGRRRAAGDDPAPPARRVPAAARDPRRSSRRPAQRRSGRRRRAVGLAEREERDRRRPSSASAPAITRELRARARGVRPARAAHRGGRAALPRERRRHRAACAPARALRHRRPPPAHVPHRGRDARPRCSSSSSRPALRSRNPERRQAALDDLEALAERRAGALAAPLLARPADAGGRAAVTLDLARPRSGTSRTSRQPGIVFKDIMPLLADAGGASRRRSTARRVGAAAQARPRSSAPRRAASSSAPRSRTSSAAASSPRASRASCPGETVERDVRARVRHDSLEVHADAIADGHARPRPRRRARDRRDREGEASSSSSSSAATSSASPSCIELDVPERPRAARGLRRLTPLISY